MKKIIYLILFISLQINAADYYYDSGSGNDGDAGTSPGTAWLHPNNHTHTSNNTYYFNRGDVWDTVNFKNFTIDNVKFRNYGTGDLPLFSGAFDVNTFVNSAGNVWYAVIDSDFPRGDEVHAPNGITEDNVWQECVSCDSLIRVARANSDINTVKFYYAGGFATNALVGSYLAGLPRPWQWNTQQISSNTSTTCELIDDLGYSFYQSDTNSERWSTVYNNVADLNSDLDWAFKDDTLWGYFTSNPNDRNIRFTMSDTLLYLNNCDNISVIGIAFEQSNWALIHSQGGTGLHVDSCTFNASSGYGIYTYDTDTTNFRDNKFTDILNHSVYDYLPDSLLMQGNYVLRNGITSGMANYVYGGTGNHGAAVKLIGLRAGGYADILYNIFDSVGLGTQVFTSNNNTYQRFYSNLVRNYGGKLGDNAGYYSASQVYTSGIQRYVNNNIFLNGTSFLYGKQSYGTSPGYYTHAIYYDEDDHDEISDSNSIDSTCIFMYHNRRSRSIARYNNVVRADMYINLHNDHYNGIWFSDQSIGGYTGSADRDSVKYNNFVLGGESNASLYLRHTTSATIALGYDNNLIYTDNNKIAYPWGTTYNVGKYTLNYGGSSTNYSLAQMQANTDNFSANASDASTTQHMQNHFSLSSVSSDEYLVMFKNFSTSSHTFTLDGGNTYRDIDSALVTGSVTVRPMYSKTLFKLSGAVVDDDIYIDSSLVYFFGLQEEIPPVVPVGYTAVEFKLKERAGNFNPGLKGVEKNALLKVQGFPFFLLLLLGGPSKKTYKLLNIKFVINWLRKFLE
jgi:hypothetical protein